MGFASRKGAFREGSLDQYLKEISQYPLIDKAEEARLAKGIKRGEEEALDKLVRSNLRFVVSVAKKYQNQGVPLSDLINEGNLGLIRAAHKFDETKGIKFISYAVWWIRQAILQALAEQSRIVRVPLNRAGALHRIGRRSSALLQELGREPTVEEIAEDLDITHGVALQSTGQIRPAIAFLEQSFAAHPYDLEILTALVTFNRDAGDLDEAIRYSEMWVAMAPDDARAAQELADLVLRRGR